MPRLSAIHRRQAGIKSLSYLLVMLLTISGTTNDLSAQATRAEETSLTRSLFDSAALKRALELSSSSVVGQPAADVMRGWSNVNSWGNTGEGLAESLPAQQQVQRITTTAPTASNARIGLFVLGGSLAGFGALLWAIGGQPDAYTYVQDRELVTSCSPKLTPEGCQHFERAGQLMAIAAIPVFIAAFRAGRHRNGLQLVGRTGTSMVTKTISNLTKYPLNVVLDGPTAKDITLQPGATEKIELRPGQYTETTQTSGNEAEPYRVLQSYESGAAYSEKYYIGVSTIR